ncbi:MAG: hypothetical protein M1832_000896 [Thelocarpon impressellum]|nr:MAG: hypothetical protein M1832_000896 [Thelocarpon impressellum]
MPPARPRGAADDSTPQPSGSRERQATAAPATLQGKSRRNGNANTAVGPSTLKDVTAPASATTTAATTGANGGGLGQDVAGGIAWSTLDTPVLHAYRHAYRLPTPAAFASPLNQMVLSNPGIGRHSPTMARRLDRRRVGKDQLALAVRKNFNGLGIQEGEVVVDFLYKVRWQDKNFRMRFAPPRNR